MRFRIHRAETLPGDHYHRLGWNHCLESAMDAVMNELGEVVSREDVLRLLRLLLDDDPPDE
jgi:hypothetical protein